MSDRVMVECQYCGGVFTERGVGRHVSVKHPHAEARDVFDETGAPKQAGALARTLEALSDVGRRKDPIDAVLVEACRGLAVMVDLSPYDTGLWGQYREAVSEMMDDGDTGGDGFGDFLAGLHAKGGRQG